MRVRPYTLAHRWQGAAGILAEEPAVIEIKAPVCGCGAQLCRAPHDRAYARWCGAQKCVANDV